MKTSSKARYAIYLVVDIARSQAAGPVRLREIAERLDISVKYLEKIATELSKSGYLKSFRGAQGGYVLARSPEMISAGDIVRTAEGGFLPVACLDGLAEGCPRQEHCCSTSVFWAGLMKAIDTYLDSVSIAQLAVPPKDLRHVG
ncbi:MAG: Rrf2 family transcriptional regulator [Coriobacteriales bacterium]|jgi:Rrf2 family protein|nr:Rrf2 family transcriptional regulator [Coriobacteriales bacterium]